MSNITMLAALLLAAGLAGHASASAWAEDMAAKQATVVAPKINEARARSIAFSHGLVHIEEIALSGYRWEIAGRDPDGAELTLDVNAHDGTVIE